MKTIGETIIVLRKKSGMTQEALASTIGIAPQTVSKWENNISLPDITLLPVIADIFDVSIDTLFGRGVPESFSAEQVLDISCQSLLKNMAAYFQAGNENPEESLEPFMKKYNDFLKSDETCRTGIFLNHGAVYYREKTGGMLLKRPKEGWSSLLENEEAVKLLELLCDSSFRRVLTYIFQSRKTSFTLNSICSKCSIENPERLKELLLQSGMFSENQIEFDEESISVYELSASGGRMAVFLGILSAAAEYTDYADNFFCCCICAASDYFD